MWHEHTTCNIREQWTQQLAFSLESGRPALLNGGFSKTTLDGLTTIVALHSLKKPAAAAPTAHYISSGQGALWTYLLQQPTTEHQIAFGGADPSTHMASLVIHSSYSTERGLNQPLDIETGVGESYRSLLVPRAVPSAIPSWESFTFSLAPLSIFTPQQQAPPNGHASTQFLRVNAPESSLAPTAYIQESAASIAVLGLVVLLVLAALVVAVLPL